MRWDKEYSRKDYDRLVNMLSDEKAIALLDRSLVQILRKRLARVKPIEPSKLSPNIITINTKFRMTDIGTGKKAEYLLVIPQESDDKKNKISVLSSIGAEILGSKIGTVVKEDPDREKYLLIEDIIQQA